MDNGELTVDYDIKDAKIIDFDEMSHKINKKVFVMRFQKTTSGSNVGSNSIQMNTR